MKACLLRKFMKKRIEAAGVILMTDALFLFYGRRADG